MIKKYLLLFCCLTSFIFSAVGQQVKTSALYIYVTQKRITVKANGITSLFEKPIAPGALYKGLSSNQLLLVNKQKSLELFNKKQPAISLFIPTLTGDGYQLELVQEDISGDLSFGTLSKNGTLTKTTIVEGLHYKGYIAGYPASIASFSIFSNGDIMALFSNDEGNFNLGKRDDSSGQYMLYNSKDMLAPLSFECGTDQLPVIGTSITANKPNTVLNPTAAPPLLCKKVRIYWEADYKLYHNNFNNNLTDEVNYLTGVFNQVAAMYQNEGILIELSELYVWTSVDPYNTSSSANGLAAIKNRWNGLGNNFNADLCVLIDGAPTNNGGIAYILDNDFCNRTYAYGYANVYATYNTIPVYSWDVEVLTHEMGHMMGSRHTHWCGWNTGAGGACGAIDNCFPVETGSSCATCAATTNTTPVAPEGFMGTVMSYCYLKSGIGVNLAYGFGPLPQAAMRSSINNASCPILENKWTGAQSTAWETAANWSCGTLPTNNTDVTIASGLTNYPVINSTTAICRKIKQQANTSVTINTGSLLKVAGVSH